MRNTLMFAGCLSLLAGSARGELKPLHHVDVSSPERVRAEQLSTEAANALVRADYGRALSLAEQGLAVDPKDPWLHYDRGVALFGMQRIDEAVSELDQAEQLFAPDDVWGRSVAIYQRAIKLQQAGRCRQADADFREYAQVVRPYDHAAAELAMRYDATGCPTYKAPIAARPTYERQPVRGRRAQPIPRNCIIPAPKD